MAVKEQPEHRDRLGRVLALDDYVAYSQGNGLHIGVITKFNPKMVKVKKVMKETKYRASEYNVYSHEMVKIEGQDALLYVMKTL